MRFGVLGTADIVPRAFLPAIRESDHEIAAVASRDAERAAAFADEHGIPDSYGSYDGLFSADVDAVYNPLPNAYHAEWTRRAADAGLAVLCEKPLTTDAASAADLFDYCADAGVTLMEAFMYRFHPQTERAREIATDEFGAVRSVAAEFTFRLAGPPDIRLDPELGGGALLDVGCYTVSAVRGFLGEPDRVYAHTADTRDSGVDTVTTGILEYEDGRTGRIAASFDTPMSNYYRVETVDGFLEVDPCFLPGRDDVELTYAVDGREVSERLDGVDQYRLEIEHFADCVAGGATPRIVREETVANMRVLDALAESGEREAPVGIEG